MSKIDSRKKSKAKRTTGYGYVGLWRNGTLGWWLPRCLAANHRLPCGRLCYSAEPPNGEAVTVSGAENDRAVLCKITVEPCLTSNGRLIKRRFRQ